MKNFISVRRKIILPLLPQVLATKAHSEIVTLGCMQHRFGAMPSCPDLIVTTPVTPASFPLKKEYR